MYNGPIKHKMELSTEVPEESLCMICYCEPSTRKFCCQEYCEECAYGMIKNWIDQAEVKHLKYCFEHE